MPVLSVRVSDPVALAFDVAAAPAGGRSALLHRLVDGVVVTVASGAALAPRGRRDALRLTVRLAGPEARHVTDHAAGLGLTRSAWVAALVRHHAQGAPRFPRSDAVLLMAIQGEVRRIGINVNQIARALNTAVIEGQVLDTELTAIEDFRRELRAHLLGLNDAFAGNLAYWAVAL